MKTKTQQPRDASEAIWTPSNMLSMLRMLMALPLAFLLLEPRGNTHWILMLAAAAYASDLLDGWLARQFGGETKFGRIIDPLADKVFITVAVLMMIARGIVPLWFGVVVVARDIIIFAGGMHLRAKSGVLVQSTMLGKATVVSIGVVLVAALFADGRQTLLTLLMLLSLGFIAASLYSYGERYFRLLKQARKR
jgi:cardiolipin synthase (CMP-forming)